MNRDKEQKNQEARESRSSKKLIAKKDHKIVQNGVVIIIKEGEEVKVPERFLETLKTEKVI